MSKHTLGPWVLEQEADGDIIVSPSNSREYAICRMLSPSPEANARLIAAAPELLAELEKANRIIINALNVMTPASRRKWDEKNEKENLKDGWALTRNDAREKAIRKARGENA